MNFQDLEKIRNKKGLRNWQFAALLGLVPKSEIKTPLLKYCSTTYDRIKNGRYNITTEIIAAAERIKGMSASEIVKELEKIRSEYHAQGT